MTEPIPYQCFFSYARADNSDYDGVVDRLKRELAGRFEAVTGSKLEIFLDHESIGWGERWRDKIASAIAGSTLFIPVITMRYFNSPACRDEFAAFHSAAARKAVTDLILPVILAGSEQITSEHPDDLVRAIAELNWQPIFNEFEAGYESAAWKRRIGTLVIGLKNALVRAEEHLGDPAPSASPADSPAGLPEIDLQALNDNVDKLVDEMAVLPSIMKRLDTETETRLAGHDLAQMSPSQLASLYAALADDLRSPAAEFGRRASELEAAARRADAELRALAAELYELAPEDTRQELEGLHDVLRDDEFDNVSEYFEKMNEFERNLRMAALVSVPLRKAISPMSTGLRSVNTALKIMDSWKSIEPMLGAQDHQPPTDLVPKAPG